MEDTSLVDAVERLFAEYGVDEIARRFKERGCDEYAASGESLEQMVVASFEIKVPVGEIMYPNYFEDFCDHVVKQAEMFLVQPKVTIENALIDLREDDQSVANHELALAA